MSTHATSARHALDTILAADPDPLRIRHAWELLLLEEATGGPLSGEDLERFEAWFLSYGHGARPLDDAPLWQARWARMEARGPLWAERALEDQLATWVSAPLDPHRHPVTRAVLSATHDDLGSHLWLLVHQRLVPVLDVMVRRCAFAYEQDYTPLFDAALEALCTSLLSGAYDEGKDSLREFMYQHVLASVLPNAPGSPTFKTVYQACMIELDEAAPLDARAWRDAREGHVTVDSELRGAVARVNRALLARTMSTLCARRYDLEVRPFAHGGCALVHKAHDWILRRDVALKLIRPDLLDTHDHVTDLFLDEILTMASVNDPNVVPILDAGVVPYGGARASYLAMPLLEGEDLDVYTLGTRLPRHLVVDYMIQALQGLAALHDQGLVHRDIKPSNIFVTHQRARDHVFLMDFGLAVDPLHLDPDPSDPFVGTPAYMPIEYVEERKVSTRLDVYQVALVFIELLTSAPLIASHHTPMTTLFYIFNQNIRLPDALADDPLAPFLRKAMAFDASERFEDAGDMLDALLEATGQAHRTQRSAPR
jgi:hypothetical protein